MTETEMWIPLKKFEKTHEISSHGNIRKNGINLSPYVSYNGYFTVRLGAENCHIHRLMASNFLENPDNKPLIDHIDRDKKNNNISNLRYATYSENAINCDRHDKCINSIKKNTHSVNGKDYTYFSVYAGINKRIRFKSLIDAEAHLLKNSPQIVN